MVLQKGVQQCFPSDHPVTDNKLVQIKGKAMLLMARLMEETANFESNAIMKTYRVCQSICFQRKLPKYTLQIENHLIAWSQYT